MVDNVPFTETPDDDSPCCCGGVDVCDEDVVADFFFDFPIDLIRCFLKDWKRQVRWDRILKE